MPSLKRVPIPGPDFYQYIILPNLGELVPGANGTSIYSGALGEFTVIDDIADSRKIIDIKPIGNIIERRDASCNIVYKPVGQADVRRLSVTELYGATKFCRQEFYQGCLKDWRAGDPIFVDRILPFFRNAIARDIVSNMYFGDTSRVEAVGAAWSTNKFDGILTQFQKNIASGRLPSGQTFNIPNGTITPANAAAYLKQMYDSRDEFTKLLMPGEISYTIDQEWADAYEDYLITTGQYNSQAANYIQDGIQVRAYKGVPIFVNKFFNPILRQITNADAHFGTLTLRGNYMFGTDKSYGEGPSGNEALVVWYDYNELTWKYLNVFKAGTAIILPENTVLALPS